MYGQLDVLLYLASFLQESTMYLTRTGIGSIGVW